MKLVVGSHEYEITRADITVSSDMINFSAVSEDTTIDIIQMDADIRPIMPSGFSVVSDGVTKQYVGFTLNSIRETMEAGNPVRINLDCYKPN